MKAKIAKEHERKSDISEAFSTSHNSNYDNRIK